MKRKKIYRTVCTVNKWNVNNQITINSVVYKIFLLVNELRGYVKLDF